MKELEKRRDVLLEWLKEFAPETGRDQKHLDMGTEARAYWHHGYFMAIKDVLQLLNKRKAEIDAIFKIDSRS